jgi:hypothetical protein
MTGAFDTLSSADEIGFGNWRVVKNAPTRSARNRQRGGGWRRLFADSLPYNNEDLHDQLTGRLGYYDEYNAHAHLGGGLAGYTYAYEAAAYQIIGGTFFNPATNLYAPVYIGDYEPTEVYNGCNIFYPYAGVPYRYVRAPYTGHPEVTSGYPNYYLFSYFYTSCEQTRPTFQYPGYPYGPRSPFYSPVLNYDYVYCGRVIHTLAGCREAISTLTEIVTAAGRKLVAGTMSRVYELNQSSGNWRILADGLGNSGYTISQCGCNSVRGMTATLGGYMIFTNGFDAASNYFLGDEASGCGLQALQEITDLTALGITRCGGVVVWRGFVIFYDFTENGERQGGTVIWGDIDSPSSFIESDTSFAGRATIAIGETILNAAPLGNSLMIYTDKSIIRVTLVGGTDVFNFETIYRGGNSLRYKFSLINGGDLHLWLGESDVYALSQFDSRPITVPWVTKAAGMIFDGISEDHATYASINKEACNLVTGGWSEETREAWLSWPTGDNICPDVTLRFNFKFSAADFIDHGFTSFLTFRKDDRPTIGQWLEDLGVCARGSLVATTLKDGPVCTGADAVVANPPQFIWNETENPNLPIAANSLCARLQGKTIADYCEDCITATTFIAASSEDFCLKQIEDDIYYREMLGGSYLSYDGYACHGEFYHHVGYQTVMQQGAETYGDDGEKMMKMIGLEAEPLPQSTPSIVTMEVGYGSQPSCFTWRATRDLNFECQSELTAAQHVALKTRPDDTFYFPTWTRGRYISARFVIDGIGGGGKFSRMQFMQKRWGQQDSP